MGLGNVSRREPDFIGRGGEQGTQTVVFEVHLDCDLVVIMALTAPFITPSTPRV